MSFEVTFQITKNLQTNDDLIDSQTRRDHEIFHVSFFMTQKFAVLELGLITNIRMNQE